MDDTKTLNPGLGGSPGDLWKKVLDEVQTDAAARRSKAAARSSSGDKRGGGAVEVDLLKRILVAMEARREDDQQARQIEQLAQRIEQVFAAVQSAPRVDHSAQLAALGQQVRELSQKLAELAGRKDDKPDAALHDALQKIRADVQAIPQSIPKPADPAPKLSELAQAVAASTGATQQTHQALLRQIADHIAALPKPADLSPQLKALEAAIAASAASASQRGSDPAVTAALGAIAQRLDALPASLEKLPGAVAASIPQPPAPAPVHIPDHTAELKAILDAVRSMPTVDPDGLASRIVEAIERIKPVDPSDLLHQLRADVQALPGVLPGALSAALPKPVDHAAKLDAIVESLTALPTAEEFQQLCAELAALPRPVDATAKLDAILASLAAMKAAPAPTVDVAPLVEQLRAELAALPKPVDATAKLDAVLASLAAMKAAPAVDVSSLVQQLRAEIAALPKPVDPTAKIEELIAATRKPVDDGRDEVLLQILESVQKPQPAYHERFDELMAKVTAMSAAASAGTTAAAVEQLNASLAKLPDSAGIAEMVRGAVASLPRPADLTPQIGSIVAAVTALAGKAGPAVDVEAAVRHAVAAALKDQADALAQVRGEIAGLRDAVRQDMAAQTTSLRDDMALRSNDVIMQVRTQSQTLREDVSKSTSRLREEIQTSGPAAQAAGAAANEEALRSVVAKLRGNPVLVHQDDLLRRLAAASRANPAHQPDVTRKMLAELPRLAEWDAGTTRAVEQHLASFGEDELSGGLGPAPSRPTPQGTVSATGSGGYSWMAHTPKKNKLVPYSIGAAALIAIGVVIFLVINALGGKPTPANGSPNKNANVQDKAKADPAKAGVAAVTDKGKDGTPAVAPAPTPAKDGAAVAKDGAADKDAKTPFELFPKSPVKSTDAPAAPTGIVREIQGLAQGVDKTRIHDIAAAKQIVFLVHSSTTSPTALASIIAELKRSLAKVGPHQKFTVVFSEGTRYVEAPPHGLRDGGDKERAAMESWIDANIRAPERPTLNPLTAMDLALSYAPDLLWIVSDGLTGDKPGQASSKVILDRIETLNPTGQTRIAATQVGPADAAGTLKAIAEKYGGAYVETAGGAVGLK